MAPQIVRKERRNLCTDGSGIAKWHQNTSAFRQ
jgi:hypothetical protein